MMSTTECSITHTSATTEKAEVVGGLPKNTTVNHDDPHFNTESVSVHTLQRKEQQNIVDNEVLMEFFENLPTDNQPINRNCNNDLEFVEAQNTVNGLIKTTDDVVRIHTTSNSDYHSEQHQSDTCAVRNSLFQFCNTTLEFLLRRKELESVVSISYPKTVRKSYSREKRLICPPPTVSLFGPGWQQKIAVSEENNAGFYASIGIGLQKSQKMEFGVSTTQALGNIQDVDEKFYVGTARNLHTDKSDSFKLAVTLLYNNDQLIGRVETETIKGLSKPTKTTKKNCNDLYISGGTKVSLFNTLNSQKSTTRYLQFHEGVLNASLTTWEALEIVICNEDSISQNSDNYSVDRGFICNGMKIKLIDKLRGYASPELRIMEKMGAVTDDAYFNGRPVKQLEKYVFQIDKSERYLCFRDDTLSACVVEDDEQLKDGAFWRIVSTETSTCSFYDTFGRVPRSITMIPIVKSFTVAGYEPTAQIELHGRNFQTDLTILICATLTNTIYRSEENIVGRIPPITAVITDKTKNHFTKTVPISLMRDDGVVFPTNYNYTYRTHEEDP